MGTFNAYKKGGRSHDMSFDRGRSDGRRKFGGRGGSRGDRGGRQLFSATCSDCGKRCEIPFKPTDNHPVFCSNCFRNKRKDTSYTSKKDVDQYDRNSGRPSFATSATQASGITRAQFESLEKKVDSILSLLHTQRRDAEHQRDRVAIHIAPETPKQKKEKNMSKKKTAQASSEKKGTKKVKKKK